MAVAMHSNQMLAFGTLITSGLCLIPCQQNFSIGNIKSGDNYELWVNSR